MMMHRISFLAIFVAAACGGSAKSRPTPPPGQGTGTGMCFVLRARAQITVQEAPGAVFLLVDAPANQRDKVRLFLRSMAARHEDRRYNQAKVRHREALVPHATSLIYTDTGARVMYTPLREESLTLLYEGLQKHVAELPDRCGVSGKGMKSANDFHAPRKNSHCDESVVASLRRDLD